eukprot:gene545-1200_t
MERCPRCIICAVCKYFSSEQPCLDLKVAEKDLEALLKYPISSVKKLILEELHEKDCFN